MDLAKEVGLLYRRSAEAGCILAMVRMAEFEYAHHPRDYKAQLDWSLEAAEKGDGEGMFLAGMTFRNASDNEKAKTWVVRAAQLNNENAIVKASCWFKV
jgi:TPR repeat protein